MVHYNIIDAPGQRDVIMNLTTGTSQADAAIIEMPDDANFAIPTAFNIDRQKEERERDMIIACFTTDMPVNSEKEHSGNQSERVIQGQHSTSNTPITTKQTYNDANRMDSDTAGHEQERYDDNSSK